MFLTVICTVYVFLKELILSKEAIMRDLNFLGGVTYDILASWPSTCKLCQIVNVLSGVFVGLNDNSQL